MSTGTRLVPLKKLECLPPVGLGGAGACRLVCYLHVTPKDLPSAEERDCKAKRYEAPPSPGGGARLGKPDRQCHQARSALG